MSDKVCCPKCGGIGEVTLHQASPQLAETMAALRKFGPMTAREVRDKIGARCLVTGMNNRLEDLRNLGFVTREKRVREWVYRERP